MRLEYTDSDYSPTYDVELDENFNFVKLHGVYNIPRCWPERKQLPNTEKYVSYVQDELVPKKISAFAQSAATRYPTWLASGLTLDEWVDTHDLSSADGRFIDVPGQRLGLPKA
jgi:hypothetical protein